MSSLEQALEWRRNADLEIVNVDEATTKLVVVEISGQQFAFRGEHISEILGAVQVYFLPGASAALEGVMSVRGDIESVLATHVLLQLPPPKAGLSEGMVLMAHSATMRSGLRIDQVLDVLDLPNSLLQEAGETLPHNLRAMVRTLVRLQDTPVAVLETEPLFAAYLQ